jgi:anti-sigma regulatory factor (Ser/Thr protein kinase)
MSHEPVRVRLHLDQDCVLAGVVRGTVQFQALQAGFEPDRGAEIAAACQAVCGLALSRASRTNDGVDVVLETFADRMEISFVHRGEALPAVGLEAFVLPGDFSGNSEEINGLDLLSRVDRVRYNTENGNVCTTLVKLLNPRN